ncbi:hypothetical protein [Celeribacter sp.]|uniref:hypothetical protein n=1 Tax=Celeribacter sp. TaxID=1890673 RepID=UPI003A93AF5F
MSARDFTSDCGNCAALCCLALAFDKGEHFAHDKAAGEPCKHLDHHDCSIHTNLAERGYKGCAAYECAGAGQRVTAMFGQSWREVPKQVAPMMAAFRTMRDVQELRQILEAAATFPLPEKTAEEREAWLAALDSEWTPQSLARFEANATARAIRDWLRGLADYVPRTQNS